MLAMGMSLQGIWDWQPYVIISRQRYWALPNTWLLRFLMSTMVLLWTYILLECAYQKCVHRDRHIMNVKTLVRYIRKSHKDKCQMTIREFQILKLSHFQICVYFRRLNVHLQKYYYNMNSSMLVLMIIILQNYFLIQGTFIMSINHHILRRTKVYKTSIRRNFLQRLLILIQTVHQFHNERLLHMQEVLLISG